jgi:tRNA(adenine34) deaminase
MRAPGDLSLLLSTSGRGAAAVAWREERPDLVAAAADPSVASAISRAVERDAGIDALIGELRPLLGKP